jgi:oligoribonuclease NrnB/cAMP/cGMP phosphodiesterase (DHH superfamily)
MIFNNTIIAHKDCDGILCSALLFKYTKNSKVLFSNAYKLKRVLCSLLFKLNEACEKIDLYVLDIAPNQKTLWLSAIFNKAYWIDHHYIEKLEKPRNVKIFHQRKESCFSVLLKFLERKIKISDKAKEIERITNEIDTNNVKSEEARKFRSFIGWYMWKYKGAILNLELQNIVKKIAQDLTITKIIDEKKVGEYEEYLNRGWENIKEKIELKRINNKNLAFICLEENFPVYFLSNKLKDKVDILCAYFKGKTINKFELRAFNNVDVLEIAKRLGGGGHKAACGGVTNLSKDEFLKEIEKFLERV